MQATREDATETLDPVVREWPQLPATVRQARRLLRVTLATWGTGVPERTAEAELVVSELVSNAVQHPRTPGGCVGTSFVLIGGETVRIEVRDGDVHRVPRLRPQMLSNPHGRGLQLVDDLTGQQWGYEWLPRGSGKLVWAHLAGLGPPR